MNTLIRFYPMEVTLKRILSLLGFFSFIYLSLLHATGKPAPHHQTASTPQPNLPDDIEVRLYRNGWNVMVIVPAFGDTPTYTTSLSSGSQDRIKLGDHTVVIEWGTSGMAGPKVTVDPPGGA